MNFAALVATPLISSRDSVWISMLEDKPVNYEFAFAAKENANSGMKRRGVIVMVGCHWRLSGVVGPWTNRSGFADFRGLKTAVSVEWDRSPIAEGYEGKFDRDDSSC